MIRSIPFSFIKDLICAIFISISFEWRSIWHYEILNQPNYDGFSLFYLLLGNEVARLFPSFIFFVIVFNDCLLHASSKWFHYYVILASFSFTFFSFMGYLIYIIRRTRLKKLRKKRLSKNHKLEERDRCCCCTC